VWGLKIKDRAFQKSFFYCSKSITAAAAADLSKKGGVEFELKKGHKKTFSKFFFDSDSFQPGDYHVKKIRKNNFQCTKNGRDSNCRGDSKYRADCRIILTACL
jgi:hypothetical protein